MITNLSDIEFKSSYLRYEIHMQQYFIKLSNQAEVKLLRPLFDIDNIDNIIFVDNFGISKGQNNIVVTLSELFVL